jgi:signal transduction histidine kinase
MDFKKIQDKKMLLKVEETPIGALTKQIASNFSSTAHERMIRFSVRDESQGATIYLERDKYDTIIYNLLSNGFKFTAGGKSVSVTISMEKMKPRFD